MPPVTEFVDHQVADQLRFEKQKAEIEADCAGTAAATPTGALCPHLQLAVRGLSQLRQGSEHWFEFYPGNGSQPTFQRLDAQLFVADLAGKNH